MKAQTRRHLEVVLNQGDVFFGQGEARIRTLLGSCVAVTLWNPRTRAGGMCHFMLPGRCRLGPGHMRGRYARDAIEILLAEAKKNGGSHEYEFKLFGGGNMFPGIPSPHATPIGEANVNEARLLLDEQGIALSAEHSGGVGQRAIMLDLWSGDVWVRHDAPPVAERNPHASRSRSC